MGGVTKKSLDHRKDIGVAKLCIRVLKESFMDVKFESNCAHGFTGRDDHLG